MAVASKARLSAKVGNTTLSPIAIKLNQLGLCSKHEIVIDVLNTQSLIAHLAKPIKLYVDEQYFEGFIKSIEEAGELYHITVGCSLDKISTLATNRIFSDVSVIELIELLCAESGISNVAFETLTSYPKMSIENQVACSDWELLVKLCCREGLVFFYRDNQLIFSDAPAIGTSHQLPYNPGNGMREEGECVSHIKTFKQNVYDNVCLIGEDEHHSQRQYKITTNNETGIKGLHTFVQHGLYACNSEAQCRDYANTMQQQLDWQRVIAKIHLSKADIRPNDLITVKGNLMLPETYRVLSVSFIQDKHQPIQAQALLIPAKLPYRLPHPLVQFEFDSQLQLFDKWPQAFGHQFKTRALGLQLGTIHGAHDDEYAPVDDAGRYRLSAAKNHKTRMISSTGGVTEKKAYGMHFPLHTGTKVVLGFIDDNPNKPVILGSLDENAVSDANPTENVMRTHRGSTLIFDDKPRKHKVSLYTPGRESSVLLDASHNEHALNFETKQSGIKVQSEKELLFRTQSDVFISAKSYFSKACKNQLTVAEKIGYRGAKDYKATAGTNHLTLCEEGDINVNVKEQIKQTGKEISFKAQNMSLKSPKVMLKSGNKFISRADTFVKVNDTTMQIQSGELLLKAKKISIDAPTIEKLQGGHFMGGGNSSQEFDLKLPKKEQASAQKKKEKLEAKNEREDDGRDEGFLSESLDTVGTYAESVIDENIEKFEQKLEDLYHRIDEGFVLFDLSPKQEKKLKIPEQDEVTISRNFTREFKEGESICSTMKSSTFVCVSATIKVPGNSQRSALSNMIVQKKYNDSVEALIAEEIYCSAHLSVDKNGRLSMSTSYLPDEKDYKYEFKAELDPETGMPKLGASVTYNFDEYKIQTVLGEAIISGTAEIKKIFEAEVAALCAYARVKYENVKSWSPYVAGAGLMIMAAPEVGISESLLGLATVSRLGIKKGMQKMTQMTAAAITSMSFVNTANAKQKSNFKPYFSENRQKTLQVKYLPFNMQEFK